MLDLLIRNGTIIDGTGRKRYRGDVGISGDRIVEVGKLQEAQARQTLDVRGLAVSPGFIDVHSHHDLYIVDRDPAFAFASFVRQGVTTSVVGNCGWTLAPCFREAEKMVLDLIRSMDVPIEQLYWQTMDEYLSYLEKQDLMCNVAHLVGHGAIRLSVMGDENRFCKADELQQMKNLARESLEAGCVGLSTGLMYYPGMFAHTDELIELARVAGEFGRPYATHLRGYCTTLPDSIAEAITISSESGASLQISHLHCIPFFGRLAGLVEPAVNLLEAINAWIPLPGLPNPRLDKGMKALQQAMDKGIDIGMDALPYVLGNTTVTVLFPPWANRGGKDRLLERLEDPETRQRIEHDIRTVVPKWPHWQEGSWSDPYIRAMGWKPIRVLSVRSEDNRWAEGKTFEEIGRTWGIDPFSALCRLALEERGQASFTFGFPARPWIEKIFNKMLCHPMMSIGADSILPNHGIPPPSAYGCFPRVLGHYSRDLGLFSLEEAVRKITSLPASRYNLRDRAEIRQGAFADIVVFDPGRVNESFTDDGRPDFATGIAHVFINGQPILSEGKMTDDPYPGRILRQP
jgi:N-acyl-D-amino-acid deacylase